MSAQLAPYPLIRPGFKGLNKSRQSDTTLGGAWALELQNAVFDDAGRVAARKGWMNQTPNGMPTIGTTDSATLILVHANSNFSDTSSFAHTPAVSGPIVQTTTKKFGAGAGQLGLLLGGANGIFAFNQTGTEFNVPANFTIETWIYVPSSSASGASGPFIVVAQSGGGFGGGGSPVIQISLATDGVHNGIAASLITTNIGTLNLSAGALNLAFDTWHSVALVRNGLNVKLYVDGATYDSSTFGSPPTFSATPNFTFGGLPLGGSYSQLYMDELRYSNVARYTSPYTPATVQFTDPQNIGATCNQLHEYVATSGASDAISAGHNQIWHSVTAPIDITPTPAPTNNNWQFLNFRGYVLGFQDGHAPIFYSGAGPFVPLTATAGTVPRGPCGLAAFGRVWAVDSDLQTIKYTALLDPHDWGGTDAGSIDMRTVWTKGIDTVQGMAAFGAAFVVFGKKHIIIWTDGQGSTVGLSPSTMYVVDTIEGTGLYARDSIQNIGTGDVVYLSPTGVQSLSRVIQTKNNPLAMADQPVNQYLRGQWISEDPRTIRSLFSPTEQFYLLILPKAGTTFCFDTRQPLEDGSLRSSEWPNYGAYSGCALTNGNLLIGFAGNIGKYSTYLDNAATYNFKYRSPWLTLADTQIPGAEFREKIPKRAAGILYTGASQTFNYTIAYNFDTSAAGTTSVAVTTTAGRVSEYATAEYGTNGVYNTGDLTAVAGTDYAEYGTAYNLLIGAEELSGSGRWVQTGIDATINNSFLSVQQLDLYAKLGSNFS